MVKNRWLFVALLVLSCAMPLSAQESIRWGTDLNLAAQQARQQQKLLLIHFYNDGCPPCERLEKNVFPQQEVAAAIERGYIPVKIHAGNFPQIAKSFQVDRWPTDVIATGTGQILFRNVSPQSPVEYMGMLDGVSREAGLAQAQAATGLPQAAANAKQSVAGALGAPAAMAGQAMAQGNQAANAAAANGNYVANPYAPAGNPTEIVNRYTGAVADTGKQLQAQAGQSVQAMQGSVTGAAQSGVNQFTQAGQTMMQSAQQKVSAGAAYGEQMVNQGVNSAQQSANQAIAQGQQYASQGVNAAGQYAQNAQQQVGAYGAKAMGQMSQAAASYMPAAPAVPAAAPAQNSIYGGGEAAAAPPQEQTWNPEQSPAAAPSGGSIYGGGEAVAPQPAPGPAVSVARPSLPVMPDITAPTNPQPAGVRFVSAQQAPAFGLDKHCPVTLVETVKWAKGDPRFGAVHRGRTYLFATAQAQQKFLTDPDRYSPVLSGCDPVIFAERGQLVEGKRTLGVSSNGHMFFFAEPATLERFEKSPQTYSVPAYQAMMQAETKVR